jgi:DNA-binding LytR/AlgR family response regulator
MIKIAICDDDLKELNITKNMCDNYAGKHIDYDLRIVSFSSPSELMLHYKEREAFDIVLLDIYMPEMSGTQLAHALKSANNDIQIIFLTTSLAHAIEAFSLHAAHYIVKPFSEEQMEDALNRAILSIKKTRSSYVVLKTSEGLQKLDFADFIYSETEKHIQHIHLTGTECLKARISCCDLYDLLSPDHRFYKCGSTYIINLAKVKGVTAKSILFENGIQLPMQRRKFKELLERFTSYALEGI